MNILWEISEKSNDLITLLDNNGFFDKPQTKHFCPKARLRVELELKMKEKWDSVRNFNLTNNEFEHIIRTIIQEEVSETLYELLDNNTISMSVNDKGRIVYSLTNGNNQYFQYENGVLKVFRK